MIDWKTLLRDAFNENNDDFTKMVTTLPTSELEREFDSGFGGPEGVPFTAWGVTHVYFPLCYDGSEWVGSAPRNPCDEKLGHQGGW